MPSEQILLTLAVPIIGGPSVVLLKSYLDNIQGKESSDLVKNKEIKTLHVQHEPLGEFPKRKFLGKFKPSFYSGICLFGFVLPSIVGLSAFVPKASLIWQLVFLLIFFAIAVLHIRKNEERRNVRSPAVTIEVLGEISQVVELCESIVQEALGGFLNKSLLVGSQKCIEARLKNPFSSRERGFNIKIVRADNQLNHYMIEVKSGEEEGSADAEIDYMNVARFLRYWKTSTGVMVSEPNEELPSDQLTAEEIKIPEFHGELNHRS
jgi:hypothetical protein